MILRLPVDIVHSKSFWRFIVRVGLHLIFSRAKSFMNDQTAFVICIVKSIVGDFTLEFNFEQQIILNSMCHQLMTTQALVLHLSTTTLMAALVRFNW